MTTLRDCVLIQVASCTLDASAKIYAGRVDSIHAQAYKMLGGLGRADNQGNFKVIVNIALITS